MPSHLHEALIELFRHRPTLAAELLDDALGIKIPAFQQARLESGELPELAPVERRADAVVVLTDGRDPVLAVVVEAQLRRDPGKHWTWPVYLANLRARLRCPALLLVICADDRTARWSATPIETGHPGWALSPLVLGPSRVPVVTDPGLATRSPKLAVLSAIAHGARPERDEILQALLVGLAAVDHDHSKLYTDVVLSALPEAARRHLEELMAVGTYEYQSDFARRYVAEGKPGVRLGVRPGHCSHCSPPAAWMSPTTPAPGSPGAPTRTSWSDGSAARSPSRRSTSCSISATTGRSTSPTITVF
jgi:hypothetical protein